MNVSLTLLLGITMQHISLQRSHLQAVSLFHVSKRRCTICTSVLDNIILDSVSTLPILPLVNILQGKYIVSNLVKVSCNRGAINKG